jgi:hypothetical protein
MAAVEAHRDLVGVKPLCDALAVSRETYYRRTRPRKAGPLRPRSKPTRVSPRVRYVRSLLRDPIALRFQQARAP